MPYLADVPEQFAEDRDTLILNILRLALLNHALSKATSHPWRAQIQTAAAHARNLVFACVTLFRLARQMESQEDGGNHRYCQAVNIAISLIRRREGQEAEADTMALFDVLPAILFE